MNLWLVMLLAGLATYATRLSFILLVGHRQIPLLLKRALRFVPLAVLPAIIMPELFMPGGNLDISLGNARFFAGLLAAVVAWRTRNIMLTILVGMIALWVLQVLR